MTGNTKMHENSQVISHVISVKEHIAKVKPIVPLGAGFVDHVVGRIILQANVKPKKELTRSKKMKQAKKNFFIV